MFCCISIIPAIHRVEPFLINLPTVSYYEVGTMLTPNHGQAALMGVFGMLAIALMVFKGGLAGCATGNDFNWQAQMPMEL